MGQTAGGESGASRVLEDDNLSDRSVKLMCTLQGGQLAKRGHHYLEYSIPLCHPPNGERNGGSLGKRGKLEFHF